MSQCACDGLVSITHDGRCCFFFLVFVCIAVHQA
jgi:hypothetical protein